MTENMLDMSASAKAAEALHEENEQDGKHGGGPLPEGLARPSAEELEVARELVRSARERLVGHGSTRVTETVYRKQSRPVLTSGGQVMDTLFELPGERPSTPDPET